MTDLRWDAVTIDCRDPEEPARFWCALLGVEVREQEQAGEHRQVLADPEGNVFCIVADAPGS